MEFFKCCIANDRHIDWEGSTLSKYFAADFDTFTLDDFNGIPNNDRQSMRDLLRKRGMHVTNGRVVLISDALMEVVKEEQLWSEHDPKRPRSSNALQRRGVEETNRKKSGTSSPTPVHH